MRPRISKEEAQFLVETLTPILENLKKQREREGYCWNRTNQITGLYKINADRSPEIVAEYTALKTEMAELSKLGLFLKVTVCEALVNKYTMIATEQKHSGRYRLNAVYPRKRNGTIKASKH